MDPGDRLQGRRRIGQPASTLRISDLATEGGLNFAAFALSVSAGFLLVVAVALFCGDTVASEASWSSLRYLLAAPVPRDRLLRQKLIVALGYSAAAVICLPVMALLAGTLAFGWNDVRVPGTGETIAALEVLPSFGVVIGYALVSQFVVAALAFLLSVEHRLPARRGRRRGRPGHRRATSSRRSRRSARSGSFFRPSGTRPGWTPWPRSPNTAA